MSERLLINCIPLLSPLTGVGRYVYEICSQLVQNDNSKKTYYYGYYSKKLQKFSYNKPSDKVNSGFLDNRFLRKVAKKVLFSSNKLFPKEKEFDIYWEPNFIPLPQIKSKYIVTSVHDFSFKHYRDFLPKERKEYFDKYFDERVKESDCLICFSEHIKNEIKGMLKYCDSEITVIPHGVRHDIFKVYEDHELDTELPDKFMLFVGSIEPRKNLKRLLKAYDSIDKSLKEAYKLVLAGFKGWENSEIMELINNNEQYISYIGYVSDERLAKIYNKSSLFVFPSIYEGFGLPILEAMACGTPVITSHTSSMPEVGGDAAIYCDPYSIEDIADKIVKVLNDSELRYRLREKGINRAKEFTWEKSALKHIEVFNSL